MVVGCTLKGEVKMKKLNRVAMNNNSVMSVCPPCACFDQCSSHCYIGKRDVLGSTARSFHGGNNSTRVDTANRGSIGNTPYSGDIII